MIDAIEKKLWGKSVRYMKILRLVPFLRLCAVCNNLAFGQVNEGSDIDLFIIAKRGRLFVVRTLVTFLLQIFGVRRHGRKIAGRFCLTFFIDDESLDLSSIALSNDIYLAFWVKSISPLIDDGISDEFFEANLWAQEFFEDKNDFVLDVSHVLKKSYFSSALRRVFGFILDGRFGNLLEKRLMNWQLGRARKKAKTAHGSADLIIEKNMLKFHNVDRRRKYRNAWFKLYGKDVKISEPKFSDLSRRFF